MVDLPQVSGVSRMPALRRWAPFLVGGLLVTYVVSRLDFPAFVAALRSTDYVAFFAFVLFFNGALLASDSLATAAVYRSVVGPVRYRDLFVIRGASYLPSIINHHVGQAWLTYFLARAYNAAVWRVAGATLIVYATTFGALYAFLLLGLVTSGVKIAWLLPISIAVAGLGVLYLATVHLRPGFLSKRQVTAPLIEIGARGHLLLMVYRLPHVAVQFFGAWLPFSFFGVEIPLSDALSLMPIIMFVVALPVSPQGLGTRDALSLSLLSSYATGTPGEQAASIAATTLSWLGALTVVQLLLSPLLMRRAFRLLGVEKL